MSDSKPASGVAPGYLHGFTSKEQDRLYYQARFLEESIFSGVHFEGVSELIEIGCGVGAQTEILLRRFPHLKIQGVDASPVQIERAKKHLKDPIEKGKVNVQVADALNLPFKDSTYDGAFVCWLLEHVAEPVEILKEARRVLRPSGMIFCNEVQNATFFVHPYSPATLTYWFNFNDHQWSLKGDPFVGAKLGNYLQKAGFRDVTTTVRVQHFDNRVAQKRKAFIEYWTDLLLSGAPGLLAAGKVDQALVDEMAAELGRLKEDPDSVFFYTWMQATGFADK